MQLESCHQRKDQYTMRKSLREAHDCQLVFTHLEMPSWLPTKSKRKTDHELFLCVY